MPPRKRDLSKEKKGWEPRFGERVQRRRKELGMNRTEFGSRLGLAKGSRAQTIRWEEGQKPSAANLGKLAEVLDTTVYDLTKGIWPTVPIEVVELRVDDLSDRLAELEDAVGHQTKGRGRQVARELEALQKSTRPAHRPRATRNRQADG
jgi:transcriptional regulator with XRE-family HTH domain